jgi:hypothetical protein
MSLKIQLEAAIRVWQVRFAYRALVARNHEKSAET